VLPEISILFPRLNTRFTNRYVPDEEARAHRHIVLRLPPYHCQYNPIELIWGLMKRDYDKHISEYGRFTEEKCRAKWLDCIQKITPQIWRNVIAKVDRLIARDWKRIVGSDTDHTDYSGLIFDVGSSSDDETRSEEEDDPLPVSPTRSPRSKARRSKDGRKATRQVSRPLFDPEPLVS